MFGVQGRVVMSITFRATMGRRRALLFALPALVLVLVTLVLRASANADHSWPGQILGDFGFTVVIPLTALIIGTSVLGAEIDDGSVLHLLATPVSRRVVIGAKYLVGTGLTMVFAAVPELAAGLIAGQGAKLAVGLFAGALGGSVIYNAVFVMLSVVTTRAIAAGLIYVLIWEGLLGNLVSGARLLSVGQYSLGVANAIAADPGLQARLSLATAAVLGSLVTVAALVIAMQRLGSFSLQGDAA
jgi:ABC-2 type transport system permease protein